LANNEFINSKNKILKRISMIKNAPASQVADSGWVETDKLIALIKE
jgi:hypothetical protein